jgi:hypothetical protein
MIKVLSLSASQKQDASIHFFTMMNQDKSLFTHIAVNERLVLCLRLVLPWGRLQPKVKDCDGASSLLARCGLAPYWAVANHLSPSICVSWVLSATVLHPAARCHGFRWSRGPAAAVS